MRRRTVLLALLALVATVLPLSLADPAAAAPLVVRGSVNQVQVTGAAPGSTLTLRQGTTTIATGTAGAGGGFVFGGQYGPSDDIPAGGGYTVREGAGTPSAPVTVTNPDQVPPQSFYDNQDLPYGIDALGYGYLTTRDGTQLAMHAQPPVVDLNGPLQPDPILINYSGYQPANPATAEPEPTLLAARLQGYGTVGVNMRGIGCSGGSFAFFEPLQATDGYDVVEAIAAQDWSANVGLFGISYPGISQLFTAAQQPPSLTAISPLSVIADTYRSTLYPGGILNNGFATDWAAERAHDSQAAPGGQPWAQTRIDGGDTTCAANQALHHQAPDIASQLSQDKPYDQGWFDSLAPRTFVDDIEVPVFLGGAWQDEQTGGHFPTMIDELSQNVPDLHVALTNGTHVESLGPDLLVSVFEFLDFYVAERRPLINPAARPVAPVLYTEIFGEAYNIALDRNWPLNYDDALAQYQAEPAIRVLWERGARESDAVVCLTDNAPAVACSPRTPLARYESTYASWPAPNATARQLFLGPDGHLGDTAPTVPNNEIRGWTPYAYDAAEVSQLRTFQGTTGEIWRTDAATNWPNPPEGEHASFTTDPLEQNLNILGSGSVDLWLRSTAPDVDVEVTLSEVRPDGQETYIQSGWLRASHRHEGAGSTALAPFHDHLGVNAAPLPAGRFSRMRVELFPVAHVVRAGSRLRLNIDAPGGSRPFWKFMSLEAPGAINDVGHSVGRPSHVTLSTVPDPGAPAGLPPCESLRGQPCREFTGLRAPTEVTAELDADARTVEVGWTAPESGGAVTGYSVTAAPTGETFEVGAGTTTFTYDFNDRPPPTSPMAFRVTASFAGGDGPASSPSLLVWPETQGFDDVDADAWFADAVDWLDAWDIATGFDDGSFRPGRPVTRAQMVNWLWATLGSPETTHEHGFSDVPTGSYADDALDWADEHEIVLGFDDGTFRPTRSITRAQLSAWLWKFAGSPAASGPSSFSDVRNDAWYKPGLDWLVENGIVSGFPNGTFRPNTTATRGQMAAWLHATAAEDADWVG
jgi:predicted acyl esterase